MEIMSPRYHMNLIIQVNDAIFKEFGSYENVEFYMQKWQYDIDKFRKNFFIFHKGENSTTIDLRRTLNELDGETLIKIAIDMGIETPDFIPSIPTFRNEIKAEYPSASAMFEQAYKKIESEPDTAIGLANSALESIIKEILKDERIHIENKKGDTLYKLTTSLLKAFKMFPDSNMPDEIKALGSGLLGSCQAIEDLRSDKTNFHGHISEDYIVQDEMYVYMVINAICTIGKFLNSFYKLKYPPVEGNDQEEIIDLPF